MPAPEDNPPTLASLRARRGKAQPARRASQRGTDPSDQADLFFAPEDPASSAKVPARRRAAQAESATPADILPVPDEGAPERRIWSVRSLVASIRQQVEESYSDLWIEGEISNCRPAPSGHIYFTLKDGEAQLPVVLFRRQAMLLRFRPADGLQVLVRGRISVYESRGQLQLIAETLEPRGAGTLQLAFEQLKARLLAEGLFDAERKRPLPAFPRCVGVITSPTGAVIRDIVTVGRRRHARLNLLVYPATMQGATCSSTVAAGIHWFNERRVVDVIIIARGGGSMEDLAGFNDEALARAIAASAIPVVSAIGHETDFTIADFVADLRAPTPSAAAELVTAAQHRVEERIDSLTSRIHRAGRFHLMHARQRYAKLSPESVMERLRDAVDRRGQRIDELQLRFEAAARRSVQVQTQRLGVLTERLRSQNISHLIAAAERQLQSANERLRRAPIQTIAAFQIRLQRASAQLEALSPVAVLSRGYALIYAEDGGLLHSAADTATGQNIHVRLGTGSLDATVTATNFTETGKR
ncbi:exodeoxyribonuclease VII large subunit [Edaphobacter sp.]|uniref:exodeoxyribonuclease VII large subunit n=1 Tax=Edaphobacter sp. TaxID=1934404 RepID=UPI002DBC016F|nr:exodeoxyribonuclease VII large subunit [Edaphobacter sp.]HEU5342070.1 exodeoxyribonuclease VII large subunit [Edaphobacter sp.]